MGTFRMYTGPDGQAPFRAWPVGRFLDWHPAPRRQFVIILSSSDPATPGWSRTRRARGTPRESAATGPA
jgi:hypothetical protein